MSDHKERIYLSPPHMSGRELKYVNEAFDTNWIAPLGPNVDRFEEEIAAYVGIRGATAVSSGTSAIHLALRLLGVGAGDRVACSTLTFVATANPILYLGAEPVFIDSEPETWNMSPQALEKYLYEAFQQEKLPKAVIVVHLYGQSARLDEILSLCNEYRVAVIEDAAESLGSTYKGKASGTLGKFGVYSFNGNKIITTSGGGMLVGDDEAALSKARFLASQARDPAPHYQHSELGYNYRLSNVAAGIGRGQLEVLDSRIMAKRQIFNRYHEQLSGLPGIRFMPELTDTMSNRWLTAMRVEENVTGITVSELLTALSEENIEARPVWKPLHMQPLFSGLQYYPHDKNSNISEELFQTGICLPSGTGMSEDQQQRIVTCIQKTLSMPSMSVMG